MWVPEKPGNLLRDARGRQAEISPGHRRGTWAPQGDMVNCASRLVKIGRSHRVHMPGRSTGFWARCLSVPWAPQGDMVNCAMPSSRGHHTKLRKVRYGVPGTAVPGTARIALCSRRFAKALGLAKQARISLECDLARPGESNRELSDRLTPYVNDALQVDHGRGIRLR